MAREVIGGNIVVKGRPVVPVSRAIRVGPHLYVSGQLAYDKEGHLVKGSIEEETDKVLENISRILKQANFSLSDVVKCTCFISAEADFLAFNTVYAKYFPENPPARTTVVAELMFGAKVEIDAIAYKEF